MTKYLVWDIFPFWLTHLFVLLLVVLDPVSQKYLLPLSMIVEQIGMIKRGAKYYLLSLSLRESKVHTIIFFGRRHPMPDACEEGPAGVGAPSRWQMPSLDHVT